MKKPRNKKYNPKRKLWIADQVLGGSGKTIGYEGAA